MKKYFLFSVALFLGFTTTAQQLRGRVQVASGETLVGVAVRLNNPKTSEGVLTDARGVFLFDRVKTGDYSLRLSYIGYADTTLTINIKETGLNLGTLTLREDTKTLGEVQVKSQIAATQQKGDTLQYNAGAFKVNPDATTEDLIKKMPGITIENGAVKAQGEQVQKVLVDGKPFFGDDPTTALRNLPAETVDKVEVFDQLSDQAQFSGFNDGNTTKTMNIVTRSDKQNGTFGRGYVGAGSDERFSGGGSVNFFNKARRISVLGLANNINQQNFGTQDLLGVMSTQSQGGGGRESGQGGGRQQGGGGMPFFTGSQNGINRTLSGGLNYTDDWGKTLAVRGSYFFNSGKNNNLSDVNREYFSGNQNYLQNTLSGSLNQNHRANLRLEYTPNSRNSLIITPSLSVQNNTASTAIGSETRIDGLQKNSTNSKTNSGNTGFTLSNNILYRYRFLKRGRTLSVNLGTDLNQREGSSLLNSDNRFFGANGTAATQLIRQNTTTATDGYGLSGNINYTEPINRTAQLLLNYSINGTNSLSGRFVNRLNASTNEYDRLDSLLSNRFDNDYLTQRIGGGITRTTKKLRLTASFAYQRASLWGNQLFPQVTALRRNFDNFLPNLQAEYTISQAKRLRFNYRTSTNAPSISQLQNVLNNNNPIQLSIGNPNLVQEYSHNITMRYSATQAGKGRNFMVFMNGGFVSNPIGTALYIASQAGAVTPEGIVLRPGVQFSRPVNLGSSLNLRTFLSYGTPIKALKSNLNFGTSLGYAKSPSLLNDVKNFSRNLSIAPNVVLGSNISEKLDFTLSYSLNFNRLQNSLQPQANSQNFTHNTGVRMNWIFGSGFVLQQDFTYQAIRGLAGGFNQDFSLWNASFGKKFLKNKAAELKITVFDLLGQNRAISRSFSEAYLEDSNTLALTRYAMLTFTYTLRSFTGTLPQPPSGMMPGMRMRERGGF